MFDFASWCRMSLGILGVCCLCLPVAAYANEGTADAQELLDKIIARAHHGNVGIAVLATQKNTVADRGKIAIKSTSFFSLLESPINSAADHPLKLSNALLIKKEDSLDAASRKTNVAETFYVNDGSRTRFSSGSGQVAATAGLREIRLTGDAEKDRLVMGQLKAFHDEFSDPILVILLPQVFSQVKELDLRTLDRYYSSAVLKQWHDGAGVFGVWQFGIYKVEICFASDTQLPIRLRWYKSKDGQTLERRDKDRELVFENRVAWTKNDAKFVPKTVVTYMSGGVFVRRKAKFESEVRLDVVYRPVDKSELSIDAEASVRELEEGGPWQDMLAEMSDVQLGYSEEAAPAFK